MELTIVAQGLTNFSHLMSIGDLARLSLKLSLPRHRDAWQPPGGPQRSRYCIARTHSESCARSSASPHARESPRGRGFGPLSSEGRGGLGRDTRLPHRGRNATRKLLIGRPERWKTRGQTILSCRWTFSVIVRCCSSTSRSSRVIGNVRPSPFFVLPGSSLTSPPAKSTWRHSSARTSLSIRQPVMYAKVAAFHTQCRRPPR